MGRLSLSDGEWKLMNLLWDSAPRTIGSMVAALENDTGWSKATVNIMLTRLADKGAVSVDASGRAKRFSPLLRREDAALRETENFLEKVYKGSLSMMVSSLTQKQVLPQAEIDGLYALLREMEAKKNG